MYSIGEKIKKIRIENGITITKLSMLSGVGQSTISEIEIGKAQNPQITTLQKISKVLGITVDDLLPTGEKTESVNDDTIDNISTIGEQVPKCHSDQYRKIIDILESYNHVTFTKEECIEIIDYINCILSKKSINVNKTKKG